MKLRCSALLLLLVAAIASGQTPPAAHRCTLRIDILDGQGGHAAGNLRVQLMERNAMVAMRFTDGAGVAEFSDLTPGNYHAQVIADGFESADTGTIEIDDWNVFLSKTIVLRRKEGASQTNATPTVSVADLNIPEKAAKEYRRATDEMAAKNWEKAAGHLNKAIEAAPQFSAAYNNLAVCYGHMGDKAKQREALQKAISFNERSVVALVNLARLAMEDKKVEEAVPLLNRALTVDPTNLDALALLADAEFARGHYEQAVAEARKVHSLPHGNYAVVHFTAAKALEHMNRLGDAVAELRLYLQEDPTGNRADFVRKVLPEMEKEAAVSSAQQ